MWADRVIGEAEDGYGFILRTAGMDRPKTELKRDLAYLQRLSKDIEKRQKSGGNKPRLLYAESDLLIYVNINLVPMDGGAKSIAIGLCDYGALQAHHNPKTIRDPDSYFDHTRSALTSSADRQAAVLKKSVKVFHIETVANNLIATNDLGFEVGELSMTTDDDGTRVSIQPKVVDAGHYSRQIMQIRLQEARGERAGVDGPDAP